MNYSVVPSGVYSVPDVRLTRQGLYGERPTALVRPGYPITPVNMLPYQVAGSSVPYGYTLVPNQAMVPQQRVMYMQPGPSRPSYSMLDYEDEEEEYVPIRPKKRSSDIINDIIDSPEMDEFSAKTREIRKNADAVLQRLNTTRPASRATDFFRTYDYDRKPLVQRYPSPLPERTLTRRSPYLEEDDDHLPSRRYERGYSSASLRPSNLTSISLTRDRVKSIYQDLDDSVSYKTPRSYDFTHPETLSLRAPLEKVQSEINRKSLLKEPSKSIGRSTSLRTTRDRSGRDATDVRSNISIRAHYAAMREAATRDVNMRKPKDIMP